MSHNSQVQASDDERERVVQRLQLAFAEGRLDTAEIDERLHAALTARTQGELSTVLADLPGESRAEPVRIRSGNGIVRRGEWRVPRELSVECGYGGVELDLSRAIIDDQVVDIELVLPYGSARIVLPHDATVDADGVVTEWGRMTYQAVRQRGAPRVHVRVKGHLGYGRLKIVHRG
ncbi:DUF1707 domain-containing protein [Nonomuraea sp. NBC_01738]|uniref:DUF1707 SHOCT-like domain-containing protein n=1 Tax=Nonomuraea sp. NBC_01738 TaxID=2976003 RepID=UPI002E15EA40|nr:DUF1707 domain-containing protein [Nonomuraea sp. NBC_01738]